LSKINYCAQVPELSDTYVVNIDGKLAQTFDEYLNIIWDKLNFPANKEKDGLTYLSCMNDLTWLDEKSISIVVTNAEYFLSKDPIIAKYFVVEFKEDILSFWKFEATDIYDKDKIKDLYLYLVFEKFMPYDLLSVKEIRENVIKYVDENFEKSFNVSAPILRIEDDRYCLAFFTLPSDNDAEFKEPTILIIVDLNTGEIVKTRQLTKEDFPNIEFGAKCKCYLSDEDDTSVEKKVITDEQLYDLFGPLDAYRIYLYVTWEYNSDFYWEYFCPLLSAVPKEQQKFYADLSI
jgi:hypothetical protein